MSEKQKSKPTRKTGFHLHTADVGGDLLDEIKKVAEASRRTPSQVVGVLLAESNGRVAEAVLKQTQRLLTPLVESKQEESNVSNNTEGGF